MKSTQEEFPLEVQLPMGNTIVTKPSFRSVKYWALIFSTSHRGDYTRRREEYTTKLDYLNLEYYITFEYSLSLMQD